jgi:hypothetical protein
MTRLALLLATAMIGLAACDQAGPPPAPVEAPGLEIGFGDVALLEAVGPDGQVVAHDDGSRAVVVNFSLTNATTAAIAAQDFPAVQLFDQDGGAWSPDMYFTPGPDGDLTNDWPADLAAGATMQGAAIFTIPAEDWRRDGWSAGWRASAPAERTVLALNMDR